MMWLSAHCFSNLSLPYLVFIIVESIHRLFVELVFAGSAGAAALERNKIVALCCLSIVVWVTITMSKLIKR